MADTADSRNLAPSRRALGTPERRVVAKRRVERQLNPYDKGRHDVVPALPDSLTA